MRRIFTLAFVGSLLLVAQVGTASAQSITNCGAIGRIGTEVIGGFKRQINEKVAGFEQRINRRKTLRINRLESASFNGCQVDINLNVTLKRRIRRDATGRVSIRANITSVNLVTGGRAEICVRNPEVRSVHLSHTLRIGEAFYRRAANRALPDNTCVTVPLP